jgi:hypothetical protein
MFRGVLIACDGMKGVGLAFWIGVRNMAHGVPRFLHVVGVSISMLFGVSIARRLQRLSGVHMLLSSTSRLVYSDVSSSPSLPYSNLINNNNSESFPVIPRSSIVLI